MYKHIHDLREDKDLKQKGVCSFVPTEAVQNRQARRILYKLKATKSFLLSPDSNYYLTRYPLAVVLSAVVFGYQVKESLAFRIFIQSDTAE